MTYNQNMIIPKKIHIIWIGNEDLCPQNCINSWISMNPEWEVHIWGNKHLKDIPWYNKKHINAYLNEIEYCRNKCQSEHDIKHMYAAISDMMRYEILYAAGGFYVDADAFCIRPLEDWLFDSDFCVVNENEDLRPGLLANGFMASVARSDLLIEIINNIHNTNINYATNYDVWKITGPQAITNTIIHLNMRRNITIWPSHYFLPHHFTGASYSGSGHVFADHIWGSHNDYVHIKELKSDLKSDVRDSSQNSTDVSD